ncbi:hypothetical protein U1Q18_000177 [Sarracenia purpurea var. burkii]
MSGDEHSDHDILLRSNSSVLEGDLESQGLQKSNKGLRDLLKRLDRGFSGRHLSIKRSERDHSSYVDYASSGSGGGDGGDDILGDRAPPEWALLLIGCLLGLATGLCVAAFNRGMLKNEHKRKLGTDGAGLQCEMIARGRIKNECI